MNRGFKQREVFETHVTGYTFILHCQV